jgi:nucleotide-binding universal stress UspA family protein
MCIVQSPEIELIQDLPMPIYNKILVPSDFSDASLSALRHASQLALSCGAELSLLHVGPERRRDTKTLTDPRAAAIQKLEQLIPPEELLQLKTKFLAHEGHAARTIVETAKEIAADLIVMVTHGRTGFFHLALGSVTESVLRMAPCPVLTVLAEKATATSTETPIAQEIADDELDAAPVIDLLRRAIGLRATDIHRRKARRLLPT